MSLLTEHDINSVRFNPPPDISTGYDQDEVDIFLNQVAKTIATLTNNKGVSEGIVTERDIVNMRFSEPSSISTGYDQDEVDVFLDEAAETIAVLIKGNGYPANAYETAETTDELKQENNDLENRLRAAEARIAELQSTGAANENSSAMSEGAGDAFEKPSGLLARLRKLF